MLFVCPCCQQEQGLHRARRMLPKHKPIPIAERRKKRRKWLKKTWGAIGSRSKRPGTRKIPYRDVRVPRTTFECPTLVCQDCVRDLGYDPDKLTGAGFEMSVAREPVAQKQAVHHCCCCRCHAT